MDFVFYKVLHMASGSGVDTYTKKMYTKFSQ
jgi:hypothetical protein